MDAENCNHSYDDLILVSADTEFRARCSKCGGLSILPSPGQDDNSLMDSFQDSLRDEASYESFVEATHKMLIRLYEKEMKLPYFPGSKDYIDWLDNRRKNNAE